MKSIIELDADMISIEHSKSGEHLLGAFKKVGYPSHIGPGVFDIHSPRVPSKDEMIGRIKAMAEVLPKDSIWVNPDCGLKTRTWEECTAQLTNMVAAAEECRKSLA
jgi:5-methyltetrahydropteroyltriglutamate--homocysteine methyltransferase